MFLGFGSLVGQNGQFEDVLLGTFQQVKSFFLIFIKLLPEDFDFDLLDMDVLPVQKFIKHVSAVAASITAPFVSESLNRRPASLWFTSWGGGGVKKHPGIRGSWRPGQTPAVRWRPGTERGSAGHLSPTGSDLMALSQQEQIERAGWIDLTFDPWEEDRGGPDLFSRPNHRSSVGVEAVKL